MSVEHDRNEERPTDELTLIYERILEAAFRKRAREEAARAREGDPRGLDTPEAGG